jgi:hypothetical protein
MDDANACTERDKLNKEYKTILKLLSKAISTNQQGERDSFIEEARNRLQKYNLDLVEGPRTDWLEVHSAFQGMKQELDENHRIMRELRSRLAEAEETNRKLKTQLRTPRRPASSSNSTASPTDVVRAVSYISAVVGKEAKEVSQHIARWSLPNSETGEICLTWSGTTRKLVFATEGDLRERHSPLYYQLVGYCADNKIERVASWNSKGPMEA